MRLSYARCAILAPALASAAALAILEPTQHFAVAAVNWSPAPTAAPQFKIFGREALQANEGNTCGYISGLSASSITCPNSQICATNTFFGVHGCCDPSSLSACIIATTCIPSSVMSASCTNDACSSDNAIAKCTESTAPECYKWLFAYESTTMTQNGCAARGFTSTAPYSYGLTSTPSPIIVTVTASASPASTPTSTLNEGEGGEKKQTLGPIVGGTIGGCTILSLVALTAFLIHRRRVNARQEHAQTHPPLTSQYYHNSPEFDPNGFPTTNGWSEQDIKNWQQQGGVHRPGVPYFGVSEVHGYDRAVEVEAPEKTKPGQWQVPGTRPVEVEAEAPVRDEKRRFWRGPVEAPT
ncbi:hypothetical protein BU25DRAFT_409845 [Macroventuria anomochaeta]|uniref:Uncharacterized protein n=1 Tax=Macroventuria anomochaeta TaxID=301207 RepID=A0ACB6S456_9PLEO|nr:uncharacterized protein BU25DRAFT_409845 [Macroventuria anomochaeta]KAF2628818.1 hypothetical protein BU25DRAFT_409845 [Macroventuria anomochaeta]